jgi:hypothetical protein
MEEVGSDMPEKKDSDPATTPDARPEVTNQQVVRVLLDLLKDVRQRSSSVDTVELPENVKRDIASATAIFILIEGGLRLETPFANTRTENNQGPGSGGTEVRIIGANFVPPAAVSFGPTKSETVTLVDSTLITAVSPPRDAKNVPVGSVDVVATTFGGTATVVNGFRYTS